MGGEAVTNSDRGDGQGRAEDRIEAVRIVLVGTTHPGNIGASARAMKAMGLRHLILVSPRTFPAADATAMAAGADDILATAGVAESLGSALEGCTLVFGTTARARHLQWPILSPAAAAGEIHGAVTDGPVAIVFGREQSGLSNAELDLCQRAIRIPTAPGFHSLNLAQAVQICAYEVRNALSTPSRAEGDAGADRDRSASAMELDNLHRHLVDTMAAVGYFDPASPKLLERRVRRLLNGANLRFSEAQILRGFLTAIDGKLKRPGEDPAA
jgi:tRNA (cytidine32/uridine32-2'-O)-methyltransferase